MAAQKIIKPLVTISHKDGGTTVIYALNAGDLFPNFGGGRHTLRAEKTASLIIRRKGPWGLTDTEYDINDENVWEWIEKHMRNGMKWLDEHPEADV